MAFALWRLGGKGGRERWIDGGRGMNWKEGRREEVIARKGWGEEEERVKEEGRKEGRKGEDRMKC